jgi:kinesin family protein 4/21/27
MNEKSSRSHAIFSLYFEKISSSTSNLNENGSVRLNPNSIPIFFKINFIDLAGSERIKKSGSIGDCFKESVSINFGLLALSKVIMALSENNTKVHIPYRDSKLTKVLKDSLNGSSITLIIACVSPSDCNYEETINTLNYASFAKRIKINPLMNFNLGISTFGNNPKYEEIIKRLKNDNYELNRKIEEIMANGVPNWNFIKDRKNKDMEILRLKNDIKTIKRKFLVRNYFYIFYINYFYLFIIKKV